MTERLSYWIRVPALALLLAVGAGGTGEAAAQAELDDICSTAIAGFECNLAASAVQGIQPRVGLALWGGNPVPGTASTGGLRLAGSPRIGIAIRGAVVPTTVPPLLDRTRTSSETGIVSSVALQSSVALAHGLAPLPTVGGFLSVDVVGRLSVARLPGGSGFRSGTVWGGMAGLRLGLLRESFTLPGVSLTAAYGRSGTVTLGDPEGVATDGSFQGRVSGLSATLAASRRVFGLRLAGGVAWDRYASDVWLRYAGAPSALAAEAVMRRWSGYGSITWSRLIYHAVIEGGWQEGPPESTLPAGVEFDPVGWWIGVAFRVAP